MNLCSTNVSIYYLALLGLRFGACVLPLLINESSMYENKSCKGVKSAKNIAHTYAWSREDSIINLLLLHIQYFITAMMYRASQAQLFSLKPIYRWALAKVTGRTKPEKVELELVVLHVLFVLIIHSCLMSLTCHCNTFSSYSLLFHLSGNTSANDKVTASASPQWRTTFIKKQAIVSWHVNRTQAHFASGLVHPHWYTTHLIATSFLCLIA